MESPPRLSPAGASSASRCVLGGGVGAGRCGINRGKAGKRAEFLLDSRTLSPRSPPGPTIASFISVSLLQGLAPRDPGLGVRGGAGGGGGVGGPSSGGREGSSTFRPIPFPDRVRLALWNQVDHKVGRSRVNCTGRGG